MDFKDTIQQLIERISKVKGSVQTEEATKTALIMPFIHALGYDIFNPLEVVPEYICDIGTKKGEKIDYAIMRDGEPIILIECKHCVSDLDNYNNQLLRYFNVSKAKFGILTNGIIYRFYTDLEKVNVMDNKPFLEINMLEMRDNQFDELRKFHKSYFDVANILNTASELKYTNAFKQLLSSELNNPSVEFVKLFAKQVYDGMLMPKVMENFTTLMKRAAVQWKNDIAKERLDAANAAISKEEVEETPQEEKECKEENSVVTTADELQAFYIVRGIVAKVVDIERVVYRDAQTYCAILLDDNNRKPICRLYFNSSNNKHIATFDADKKEIKHQLSSLNDIYKHSDAIMSIIGQYDK